MYGSFDDDENPPGPGYDENSGVRLTSLSHPRDTDGPFADDGSDKSSSPMLNGTNSVHPDEKRFSNPLAALIDPFGPKDERSRSEDGSILSEDSFEGLTLHQAAAEGDIDIVKTLIELFERDKSPDEVTAFINFRKKGYAPLHLAARYNRKQVVAFLLTKGADINITGGEDGLTALHIASKYNTLSCVKILLENENIDIGVCSKYGATALHFAARRGNLDICRWILEKKNNLDTVDGMGATNKLGVANAEDHAQVTPLHTAMLGGDKDIVTLLIEHGAKPDARDKQGEQPIHFAAADDQGNLIAELVRQVTKNLDEVDAKKRRAELVDARATDNDTALHIAAQAGYEDTVKTLVSLGANVNARTKTHSTPLHLAVISGYIKVVKFLCLNGAKINAIDGDQMTPMHKASQYGRLEIIEFLRTNGGKIDVVDKDNFTPLLCSVWKGQNEVVKYLLDNNADYTNRDINEKSVIHLAVEEGHIHTLEILMERGAVTLINMPDKEQKTPLHYAALQGNEEAVDLLLKKGSKVDVSDHEERSPLHIAADAGNLNCVLKLGENHSGSVNSTDERGKSPLHLAAEKGHIAVSEALIEMGAETSARDDKNWTPLDYAAFEGFPKTMKVLLDNDALVDAADKNFNTPLHHASSNGHVDCIQLLLDYDASIELEDNDSKNCLDHAVEWNQQDACLALISHKRWREVLSHVDKSGYHPMEKLIAKAPSVAEMVLTNSITYSNLGPTEPDYSITYDFRFLDLPPDKQKGELYFGPANMVRHKREELLSHPLTVALINNKWQRLGRTFYILSLSFYIFFVTMLTTLLVIDKEESKTTSSKTTFQEVVPWLTLFLAVFQIGKEIFQLYFLRWSYFKDFENYLEVILYTSTILFMMPFIIQNLDENLSKDYENYLNDLKWNSGAICILLAWGNLLLYLKRFPYFGLYVVMFVEVLKTVFNVLLLFSICIVAFALAFFVLMDGQEAFEYVGRSIIKVGVMTIGEFEYDSIFTENLSNKVKLPYKVVSYLIFYLFLVMMPILLMNLLVGLAVGDIEVVRKTAYLRILRAQVHILKTIENSYPKSWLKTYYDDKIVVKPNERRWYRRLIDWIGSYDYQSLKNKQDEMAGKEQLIRRELDHNRACIHKQKKKMKSLLDTMERQMEVTKRIAEHLDISLD